MDPVKFRSRRGIESFLQEDWIKFLNGRGWMTERLVGNAMQKGLPDIFAHHPKHGSRWIDFKVLQKYEYTKAQIRTWPLWESYGLGVYIIAGTCKHPDFEEMDREYQVLFGPPNFRKYWKPKYNKMIPTEADIDNLLDQLAKESE